ncbi:hypothetical protein M0Q50_07005 [bacterium]|jgi:hypothetical protein|nr:hypothetical protein [bacterium]
MKTGCYFTYKGDKGIGISLSVPKFWHGDRYMKLAPTPYILDAIKSGKINEEEYIYLYYRDVLSKLNVNEIYEELKDKVLLCWEKPEKFCHRIIVANWIKEKIGVEVIEWNKKDKIINKHKSLF